MTTAATDSRVGESRSDQTPSGRVRPLTTPGWWLVAGVLGVALAVRVIVALSLAHGYHPVNDAQGYDLIARSIANGHGYGPSAIPPAVGPSAYRAPLYPGLLAVAYFVFGHSFTVGLLEEALIGVAVVAMVGVVSAQLFSRRVAFFAMAIAALHPTLVLFGSSLMMEPLLELMTLSALAAALQHRRAPHGLLWPAVAGALLGLALETRELAVALVIPVLWLLSTARVGASAEVGRHAASGPDAAEPERTSPRLAAPVLAVGLIVAILAPWTIRNAVRLHTFAPISTSTGYTLSGTYNDTSAHNKQFPTIWIPPYNDPQLVHILLSRPRPSEAWTNSRTLKATYDYVKAHPGYPFRAAAWNTAGLFDLQGSKLALYMGQFIPYPRRLTRLSVYSSWLLGLLAVVAVFLPTTRRAPRVVWLIPITAFVLLVFVSGNIRYRASIEPYTVLLSAVTVAWAYDRWVAPALGRTVR
jgi:hypothetical protein